MTDSSQQDTRIRRPTFRPRVTVGAAPGQLVAHDGSVRGTIRVIHYDASHHFDDAVDSVADIALLLADHPHRHTKPRRVDDQREACEPESDNGAQKHSQIAWINIDGVGDIELLKDLGEMFKLHPLALEDVVNVHQHAKLECYGDTLFFVARMPMGDNGFETEQLSLFLVDGVVITIQERPGDCLDPVRNRIADGRGRIRKRAADYLAYAIIDAIIDGYYPLLERYNAELDRAAQRLQSGADKQLPLRLHDIRADLLLIRKVVLQHRDAVNELLREGADLISGDNALYFRDCQDHINQLIEIADTDRETCGELRELYFAMLGEKNNDAMKVLTVIATIFIPMSFIAGIYGMNFDSNVSSLNMPELQWAFGYPFALGLMALLASGLLVYLFRKGWLSS